MACIPNIQTIQNIDFSGPNDAGNWTTTSLNPILTTGGKLVLKPSSNSSTFTRILGIPTPANNQLRLRSNFQIDAAIGGPALVEVNFNILENNIIIFSGCAELTNVEQQVYDFQIDRLFNFDAIPTTPISLQIIVPEGWQYEIELIDLIVEDQFYCQDNIRTYFIIDELLQRSLTAQSAAVELLSWKVNGVESLTPAFFSENNIVGGNPLADWLFANAAIDGSNRAMDNITPNTFNPFYDDWGMDFNNVAGNYFGGKTIGTRTGSNYGPEILRIGFEKPSILNGALNSLDGAFFIDLDFENSFEIIFNVIINQNSPSVFSNPTLFRQYTIEFDKDFCTKSMTYIDQLTSAVIDESQNAFLYGITNERVDEVTVGCDETFAPVGASGNFQFRLELGTGIDQFILDYNAYGVPDRFIVNYDGVDYDTGFVGLSSYDSQLIAAGVNPGDINTTPSGNGAGQLTIPKPNPTPTFAIVTVEAPLGGTGWQIKGNCPSLAVAPTPPTIVFNTSTPSLITGNNAQFSINASGTGGATIVSWTIDWGDGSPVLNGTGQPPTSIVHRYTNQQTNTATMTVFDSNGLNANDTAIVQTFAQPLTINSQENVSCFSCFNFTVKVPATKTYNVQVISNFTSPAQYAAGLCTPFGTQVAANLNENITADKTYYTGIDAYQGANYPLVSTIKVEVRDGATLIQSHTFTRYHQSAIC